MANHTLDPAHPKSGKPFRVVYGVAWDGGAGDYAILPAEPPQVAWGTARLVGAESRSGGDGQHINYTVEFVSKQAGAVEIPPFPLAYTTGSEVYREPTKFTPATTSQAAQSMGGEKEPVPAPDQLPLEVPGFVVNVGHYIGPGLIASVAGTVLALTLAGLGVAMRVRGARARNESPIPGAATVQSVLYLARQHRLDGKFYDYYRTLAQAATLAAPSVAARKLRDKLEGDAQRVGYGALQPTEDDLEGALRDLERVLRGPAAPKE